MKLHTAYSNFKRIALTIQKPHSPALIRRTIQNVKDREFSSSIHYFYANI